MNHRSHFMGPMLLGAAVGAAGTMAAFYAGDWHFRRQMKHLAQEAVCSARSAAKHMGM